MSKPLSHDSPSKHANVITQNLAAHLFSIILVEFSPSGDTRGRQRHSSVHLRFICSPNISRIQWELRLPLSSWKVCCVTYRVWELASRHVGWVLGTRSHGAARDKMTFIIISRIAWLRSTSDHATLQIVMHSSGTLCPDLVTPDVEDSKWRPSLNARRGDTRCKGRAKVIVRFDHDPHAFLSLLSSTQLHLHHNPVIFSGASGQDNTTPMSHHQNELIQSWKVFPL